MGQKGEKLIVAAERETDRPAVVSSLPPLSLPRAWGPSLCSSFPGEDRRWPGEEKNSERMEGKEETAMVWAWKNAKDGWLTKEEGGDRRSKRNKSCDMPSRPFSRGHALRHPDRHPRPRTLLCGHFLYFISHEADSIFRSSVLFSAAAAPLHQEVALLVKAVVLGCWEKE